MQTLKAAISAALLPELEGATATEKWLNCATEFPWYPVPFIMIAEDDNVQRLQKASIWFPEEQRLHLLMHDQPWQQDKWLMENKDRYREAATEVDPLQEAINLNQNLAEELDAANTGQTGKQFASEIENTTQAETVLVTYSNDLEIITDNNENKHSDKTLVMLSGETALTDDEKQAVPLLSASEKLAADSRKPEPILFEPFYSVDYFASQGIKLDLNAPPTDKFDRQLKSFTQWLKTMKKVAEYQPLAANDPTVDAQANYSILNKQVITEAMAHVLIMQGKYSKAADIYQKLILLHPEKSAFFAGQIEELKNKK